MANDDAYDNSRVPLLKKVSDACREDLIKDNIFIDCYGPPGGRVNINNIKEKCELMLSEKCMKFNENPLSVAPGCVNDEKFKYILPDISVDSAKNNINCYFENGNLCPTSYKTLTGNPFTEDAVLETCKSANCTEKLLDLLERSRDASEEFHLLNIDDSQVENFSYTRNYIYFQKFINILQSEKCTSKLSSSGTSTFKKTSVGILFTILSLTLNYLL